MKKYSKIVIPTIITGIILLIGIIVMSGKSCILKNMEPAENEFVEEESITEETFMKQEAADQTTSVSKTPSISAKSEEHSKPAVYGQTNSLDSVTNGSINTRNADNKVSAKDFIEDEKDSEFDDREISELPADPSSLPDSSVSDTDVSTEAPSEAPIMPDLTENGKWTNYY